MVRHDIYWHSRRLCWGLAGYTCDVVRTLLFFIHGLVLSVLLKAECCIAVEGKSSLLALCLIH